MSHRSIEDRVSRNFFLLLLFFFRSRRWSNVNRPGQWLFQVGPISDEEDIKVPDNVEGKILGGKSHFDSYDPWVRYNCSLFADQIAARRTRWPTAEREQRLAIARRRVSTTRWASAVIASKDFSGTASPASPTVRIVVSSRRERVVVNPPIIRESHVPLM